MEFTPIDISIYILRCKQRTIGEQKSLQKVHARVVTDQKMQGPI
jgi:hypothetical protein